MATVFKQQSHVNITPQHPITLIHFLSGWLPSQYLLLHNWTIWWKVHTMKLNFIEKTVPFHAVEKRSLEYAQCNQNIN